MQRFEWMWDERNLTRVLVASGAVILAIALVDWSTKLYVSLGFLYLFPIMLSTGFLPRWVLVLLGAGCALLALMSAGCDAPSNVSTAPLRVHRRLSQTQSVLEVNE